MVLYKQVKYVLYYTINSSMEKKKDKVEQKNGVWDVRKVVAVLNRMLIVGFIEKVAFGQRLEGSVNVSHVALCPNSVPGRGKSKQKPLSWDHAWGITRKPERLEHSEWEH